jgi:predicted permease
MFTAITLITLAVGVGANTLVFSVVEGVLLKPLPYPHPEQLIGVWHSALGLDIKDLNMAPFLYFTYREQSTTMQDVGAYTGDSVTVTGVGQPEHVMGLDVTDGVLPMLGVKPVVGRLFTRLDDTAGSPETVVISFGYWQRKFGGSPSAVGQTIVLDGRPRQIIGVMPQGFQFLDYHDAAIVMPFQWDRSKVKLGNFSERGIARLKPGVTLEQASADVARLLPIGIRSFPAPEGFSPKVFESAKLAPNLRLLQKDVIGDIASVLWVLMGSIGMVLLVACANVANLLLVRAEGRRQELAIRTALGAGRGRITADLMIESIVLGLTGSAIGLALACAALRALIAAAPPGLPRLHEIGIDLPVLGFTLGISIFVSIVIGLIPVLKFAGSALNSGIREGGRGLSQSRERHRARKTLVVVQVALALVLLICSGLMIRTFNALTHVAPGFTNPAELETFRLDIPDSRVAAIGQEAALRMQQEILNKLATVPGVTSVSFSSAVPLDGYDTNDVLFAQDRAYAEGELPPIRRFVFISPGFFENMGTTFLAGSDMTWAEVFERRPVAIISENFAKEYWHSAANALGKRIRVASTDDWREIIGVVQDVHTQGVSQPAPAIVYWPTWRARFEGRKDDLRTGLAFNVRSPRAGSQAFFMELQQAVWSVDPELPLANPNTLGEFYTKSMARTSFTLVMLSVAGAMALLLGAVGIYGVIAYSVAQRTREIGIRMALGAQRGTLTSMFVVQGLALTGIGIILGLGIAFAAMRLMSSLLFNVSPMDPLTYAATTAAIVVIAYFACYLPSRRAATVDPVHALRAE